METALILVAVALGALVQGSVGFGFAFVVVPVLALASPESLPATVLLLAFPMTSIIAVRERGALDLRGLVWLLSGRLAGTFGGIALLVTVREENLSVLTGGLVLVAVVLSAVGFDLKLTNTTRLLGGLVSGVTGTAAALGGPPLAFVYQRRPGPQLRSTLSVTFAVGTLISLTALTLTGRLEETQVLLALKLLPAMLLGLVASRWAARFLDGRWLRPAVLAFAAVGGVLALTVGLT